MSGWGRLGLVPREVGSIGSIPAKTGLHQDKMRNKSRMNEKLAQGQVFITSAPGYSAKHPFPANRLLSHDCSQGCLWCLPALVPKPRKSSLLYATCKIAVVERGAELY